MNPELFTYTRSISRWQLRLLRVPDPGPTPIFKAHLEIVKKYPLVNKKKPKNWYDF